MIDYRNLSNSELSNTIQSFSRTESLADDVRDGLLAVAVFHSIKDGQVTPARDMLAGCSKSLKDRVSKYLTKFGNIKYSKEKGLGYDKRKTAVQFGIEKANEVFESLPTLAEAFPSEPTQYRDIPLIAELKRIVKKARELEQHSHRMITASDEEKQVWESIQHLVAIKG